MKGILSILLVIFNLLLIFSIISFDNRKYSILASQIGPNSTENTDTNNLFTFFKNFKVNATESPSIKVNATESPSIKVNATESPSIKVNATESPSIKVNATESPSIKVNATESAIVNANNPSSSEATAKTLKFCYNSQFGSLGTEDGQFNRPHDIVFDSKGFLYVNDRELNNFQKLSPEGKFISKFGEKGEELGQYKSPYSMVIDSNDKIYVLDRGNDRIVKVDTEGNVLGALYSFNGTWVTNNDEIPENEDDSGFSSPEAMAIDKEGNFYLTDTGNNIVIKFDKNFKFLSQFGIEGSAPGQFDHPHGIGIDSDGNIFINELNNARIQKFTNDGKFIKEWGTNGTGPGQFTLPLEHLKVDKNDRVFITDGADNPRVQVFDKEGNFLTQFGKLGIGNGEFKKPEHVAFNERDDKGTVYVVDRGNARIQTFLPCN